MYIIDITAVYKTADEDIVELEIDLEAGTYKFKIAKDSSWDVSYGNSGTFDDTTNPNWWKMDSGADCTINATGGTYKFQFRISDCSIYVTKVA